MQAIGLTFAAELAAAGIPLDGLSWDAEAGVLIAWSGDDQRTAAEAILAKHDPAKAAFVSVLASVTNYQTRAMLVERGLFDKVDTALRSADMTVTANRIALQAWDYANGFSRNSAIVTAMAGVLGLSSDDVDGLFIAAEAVQ